MLRPAESDYAIGTLMSEMVAIPGRYGYVREMRSTGLRCLRLEKLAIVGIGGQYVLDKPVFQEGE